MRTHFALEEMGGWISGGQNSEGELHSIQLSRYLRHIYIIYKHHYADGGEDDFYTYTYIRLSLLTYKELYMQHFLI